MDNEDFDLYGDLDEALIEPLQEEVQKKQAEELEKQKKDENFREETEKIINELKTSNFQLKKNMSLLLATAKSEIERKDQQIKDLRREMDEIIFRKNKGSKKTCDKWAQTDFYDSNRSNSSRYNDSSKLHDRHKPKEPADSDRHKRKLSPERRYSDDYRKASHRDDNIPRSKNHEGRSRKLSHENTRSRSPEKHEKKTTKQELREDDLRKILLKNKNDDKTSSSSKESSKKTDDKRDASSGRDKKDKYKEKDRIKEKGGSKSEKTDEKRDKKKSDQKDNKKEKVIKEKLASPKKVKEKGSEIKNVESVAPEITKPSIESVKKEIPPENTKDVPKTEITLEEKVASPQKVMEEVNVPKSNEIAISIFEKSSSSKENEIQETNVDKTEQKDTQPENVEVMSSNLNLSAESDTNEAPIQSENVTDKDVKEEKTAINEKLPENPSTESKDCKAKEEVSVKTEEEPPKKQKYVPIFEAKIFTNPKDIKSHEIKSEKVVPIPKQEDKLPKSAQKFTPIDRITSKELLPITVTIENSAEAMQEETIITEEITAPITEVMQEIKEEAVDIPDPKNEINSATESLNDSFESTKENSLNNSFEKRKHKKRKITTEVEADGTVVWTVTRKKRKTKQHS